MKVVWVNPRIELQAGAGGITSQMASVRYRALIPARALAARGHQASVIGLDRKCFDSVRDELADADIVVFRKNYYESDCTERMLEELQKGKVKTLFDVSDDHFLRKYGPHIRRMIAQAGSVVTASTQLRDVIRQHTQKDSSVVGDPFEGTRGEPRWSPEGPRLKALWFGHGTNLPSLLGAVPVLTQAGMKQPLDLRLVTRHPELEASCKRHNSKFRNRLSLRYAQWSIEETASSLAAADFVVIPARMDTTWTLVKSPNRIIESLWAGRFVVAHPIPSYLEFREWAWIGADLAAGIAWLAAHGVEITERIRAAQDYIAEMYSPQRIGLEWEKVFEKA